MIKLFYIICLVDTTAPEVEILMRPTDFSNNTNELLSFRCASYRDTCQFVCGYNSSNFEPNYHPCTSPYMIFGLINNIQYQFSLIATDDVGNTGEEVTISWIVGEFISFTELGIEFHLQNSGFF